MAQLLKTLSPTWGTWIELQAAGFSLTQPQLLRAFEDWVNK